MWCFRRMFYTPEEENVCFFKSDNIAVILGNFKRTNQRQRKERNKEHRREREKLQKLQKALW